MATQPLREYLQHREDELRQLIAQMREELKQVRAAKEAIAPEDPSQEFGGRKTIKDMVMRVLRVRPSGATAEEIIQLINEHFAVQIERTSMSPQLSRLRQERRLEYGDDKLWRIAPREDAQDENAAEDLSGQ